MGVVLRRFRLGALLIFSLLLCAIGSYRLLVEIFRLLGQALRQILQRIEKMPLIIIFLCLPKLRKGGSIRFEPLGSVSSFAPFGAKRFCEMGQRRCDRGVF